MATQMTFDNLAQNILAVHHSARNYAKNAVNQALTIRNWLIGFYIVEYEQKGCDRAQYGTQLLKNLESKLNTKGLNNTLLKNSRKFYLLYPEVKTIIPNDQSKLLDKLLPKSPTPSDFLTASQKSPTPPHKFKLNIINIVQRLSFSHICEIMTVDDEFARCFYELECIKCGWNIKELRRQIATNLFFRTGISKNPEKLLSQTVNLKADHPLTVKDPFVFEFLGLDAKETVSETDLEQALMDHLQDFLMEMGKGFCFEARQKRIIIDDQYHFIDLVLYNRILHCNVIIELKNDEFSYQHFGQLNAYVAYYKENEMHKGDNPPVGILLCTQKGPKMVEYALSGIDNQLFATTYMLQLPHKEQLMEFMQKQLAEMQ